MLSLKKIREKAGETEWLEGQRLLKAGQVRMLQRTRLKAEYMVAGDPYHTVTIGANDSLLSDGLKVINRYTVAAVLFAARDGTLRAMALRQRSAASDVLFDAAAAALPLAENLKLEPTLTLSREGLSLSLRTGENRLYVVRHIPDFLEAVRRQKSVSFGKGFTYEPRWSSYNKQQRQLLGVLDAHCRALEMAGASPQGAQAREMPLNAAIVSLVLGALENMPFRLEYGDKSIDVAGIARKPLPFVFEVSGSEKSLAVSTLLPDVCQSLTEDGAYLLVDDEVVSVSPQDRAVLRAVLSFRAGRRSVFLFGRDSVPRVMGELLPALMRSSGVTFHPTLRRRMVRFPLQSRVYLDKDGVDIVARTVFAYGSHEIDPFVLKEDIPPLLLRDAAGEKLVMEELALAGFHVRRGYAFMNDEESVYRFVTGGASRLSEKAQVFFSNEFRKLTVRTPRLSGALKSSENRLVLELYDDDTPVEELLPLLDAIRRKKRYFRYSDGTFLSLEGAKEWEELAEAYCEARENNLNQRDVGLYRAAYLNALVKEKNLPVTADSATLQGAALRTGAIQSPIQGLYAYQQRGFEWLYSLYRLRMGGILADEMGLGKTVQMLAAILYAVQNEEERIPSIVITPTSLVYNWQLEAKRFAPQLSTLVVSGTRAAREKQIAAITGPKAPDLVITSYPVIRQDIDAIQDIPFRFAVLDEAQNIKNPVSMAAHSVKRLDAQAHVALSGTPMENNVGELWSLFDFALPGYLPPFREFLRRFDEGRNAQDLRRRIRPFLMRRLKSEVMAELPEKTETTLYAAMEAEQRKVYSAVLLQKRESVQNLLARQGLKGSRGEVLAAMTELRQICCHPQLVLDTYLGESAKLELLMEILPPILENGHRVLLFSQFTKMLAMIKPRLDALNITSMYLDGDTPARERLELTQRFNEGEGQMFLISLKAGGTGLNLTGADTVIHYDPWWNPTTEDQAIDRAHRVGQDKKVQVIRLVTLHSIEEQVVQLGARKRKLFDKLVTAGEVMPEKLKTEDILALFKG